MILQGDVLERLRLLPDDSVHTCVTSPPYWGLRDYGVDGQIGLERTLGEHIETMVRVFREVRRVLRKDGTLWLNYGDAYASAPNGRSAADVKALGNDDRTFRDKPMSTVGGVFKNKDRMLLPARCAISLQEDGWYLRDEIIWHKPNPMPVSVTDRTTPAHEMIYLFSKSPRYYYDQEAIKEPIAETSKARYSQAGLQQQTGGFKQEAYESGLVGQRTRSRRPAEILKDLADQKTRNKRSVWTIAPKPFKEAHFATFPPDLIEPCILAGAPEKCCAACGKGFERIFTSELVPTIKAAKRGVIDGRDITADRNDQGANRQKDGHIPGMAKVTKTLGWEKTCKCPATETVAGTVLDPFFGAGTTGLVAIKHGRRWIGIELNPAYVAIAEKRLGLPACDARDLI